MRIVCAALLAIPLVGCGPSLGDVSGTVLFEGKPIPSGRVLFMTTSDPPKVFGGYIKNGTYSIAGVPVGEVKVSIESFAVGPRDTKNIPKGVDAKPPPGFEEVAPNQHVPIPKKYRDFDKSGLKYTVTVGSQKKDFNLDKK
jgi:hypothetical protein